MAKINPSELPGFAISRETLEQVTIIGPQSKRKELFRFLDEGSFRVVRSGPYTDRKMFPRVDLTRVMIVAVRSAED